MPNISVAELCVFCFALGAMMVVDVAGVVALFRLWREVEEGKDSDEE